ncbi:DNA helicase Rep [Metapseudomonas otitidis]|jgi:ATP-dependent DNA helicase Rep|uniref:ATP-dependent DNA helicase Rep n=1 Tax=Metapseudomonas otitidis TaxID=319939 RepID=A0A1I0SHD8_9GAMM|nr:MULTISPECIES: DNA helicase Rep [Pseudomonas]MBO2926405.1 DNA helicase Rep [Pseudomonas otitidis]MCO7553089.1 DNA helicase Rep [Pseudomonas otitidis]MCP1619268.1 ATP-dependent DNA helicase Rep [Pseudomonas otitidis]MDH1105783.1 DNA helicase Rep [Pseudomonas otitidis]MDH1158007.1 DNA helicase Rep [Pseudomonas otitidis]
MSRLNPRQQEAVNYVGGPLLVLAGAGSGKTSVITRKIAYLVQQCGIRAQHIVAVTFTNKAAREMKERVSSLLRGAEGRGLTVSTFHNLGLNIIRKEHARLGYKPGFSIFDETDIKALLSDIMQKEYSGDDGVDEIKNCIGNWKNDLVLPEEALANARNPKEQTAAIVYLHYQRTLKAYNAVDFDDLILLPVKLFQDNPDILEKWQYRVRYMLVDEYQDTNASQYLLVKLLVQHRAQFTVVGDDDQSIYAWRGARPENLMQLKEDFPSLKVVMLEQNYRSTSRILKCANVLIANNPHVFEKQLWSEMGVGDPIRVIRCRNEDAEAERIAMEILTLHLRTQRPYSDFAILYRGNHQAKLMELKLQHHQIPYRLSGGTSFFGRQEVKDLMSYFRLLVNPDDDNAFLRVINVPRREIGSTTLEKLGNYATERKISMYAAADEIGLAEHLDSRYTERLQRFKRFMDKVRQQCAESDPIAALRSMVMDIDYENWIRQNASSDKVADFRMGNVWFLVDALKNTLERDEEGGMTIEEAIAKLVLRDMLERQQEEEEGAEGVQMMTLHASKGLEFPYVFIMGVEEDILPHRSSIEADTIEEERRLAYVGITRARQNLAMTFAAKRKQYGEIIDCSPSRFLDELPPEDLEWEGMDDTPTEVKAVRGNTALADIRAMLKKP